MLVKNKTEELLQYRVRLPKASRVLIADSIECKVPEEGSGRERETSRSARAGFSVFHLSLSDAGAGDGDAAPPQVQVVKLDDESRSAQLTLAPSATHRLWLRFAPEKAGIYRSALDVLLDDQYARPFAQLPLSGRLLAPAFSFSPPTMMLTPAPLSTLVEADFQLHAVHYTSRTKLSVHYPELEAADGRKLGRGCLKVVFLHACTPYFSVYAIHFCTFSFEYYILLFLMFMNELLLCEQRTRSFQRARSRRWRRSRPPRRTSRALTAKRARPQQLRLKATRKATAASRAQAATSASAPSSPSARAR